MDAAKIAELAVKSGIKATDTENIVAFALGFADGARNSDSTETVHLYGAAISANVTPVWGLLEDAGIPFEYHEVDLMGGAHLKEDFLCMNPYHTVPTIKHGDTCLHESSTIMRYLTRAFPTAASKYYGNGDVLSQATIDRGLDVRQSSLYNTIGAILYPVMGFKPKPSDEDFAKAHEKIVAELQTFADVFLSKTPFIGGDSPSIADFSIAGPILHLIYHKQADNVPEAIKKWAAAFEAAAPGYMKVMSGKTNGAPIGSIEWGAMRSATYDATEAGKMNGQ